ERTLNVLLAGIGGQGVLTAAELLCGAAMHAGHDVKKSEVHGMAQRGGVVTSHVRLGRRVYSPVISEGEVDVLVAFEEAEALRWQPEVRSGGLLVVNCLRVLPPVVNLGVFAYPDDPLARLRSFDGTLVPVEASALAVEEGSPRLAGTILVGAAAGLLPLSKADWEAAIRRRFSAAAVADQNLKAFRHGWECVRDRQIR
ncbi:MAG TPA: indolepyruvate oxidoreductase subunit beta, partial [Candidatus Methylomirabilis sp.]|nr:indolepyruvate oxidoreductase subunit beta [Candidatus Methylomirabilis sp.]